jgi:hypothetical protein
VEYNFTAASTATVLGGGVTLLTQAQWNAQQGKLTLAGSVSPVVAGLTTAAVFAPGIVNGGTSMCSGTNVANPPVNVAGVFSFQSAKNAFLVDPVTVCVVYNGYAAGLATN